MKRNSQTGELFHYPNEILPIVEKTSLVGKVVKTKMMANIQPNLPCYSKFLCQQATRHYR